MEQTFPFLSQLAQNFTLYEFQGLLFEYVPTSGEYGASASNALGKVIMATQYDPDAPSFNSTIAMSNYDYAISVKPSECAVHGVENHPNQRPLGMQYVRSGTSTKDLAFTDIGNFQIATEGIAFAGAGTAILGELWVTYKVKLSRANLYGALLSKNVGMDLFYISANSTSTTGNTATWLTANHPTLLTNGTYVPQGTGAGAYNKATNSIGVSVTSTANTNITLTWPKGQRLGCFLVIFGYDHGAGPSADISLTPAAVQGCTVYNSFSQTGMQFDLLSPLIDASGSPKANLQFIVAVDTSAGNAPASATITWGSAFPSGDYATILITEICKDCIISPPQ
jgi:hypothetical protein